jgi:hypothetical protein
MSAENWSSKSLSLPLDRSGCVRDFAFPFVTGMDGAGVVERTCSDNYSREKAKGDSSERFKQRTSVGCNRASRKTCRKQFKKEGSKLFGRLAEESESGKALRINLDHRDLSISMIHERSMRH